MPYLPPNALPATLWRDGRYHVAKCLHAIYVEELSKHGLLSLAATEGQTKKVYGGVSQGETHNHFTHRFCASVVRLQNVILDTQNKFGAIQNDIIQLFASHHVAILDIPCGTGAGGLGLISIIHELRLAGVIPNLPLNIDILAGDVSPHALEIYASQVAALNAAVNSTGIDITFAPFVWDALSLASSNHLCSLWEKAALPAHESFVLVMNFSGAGDALFAKLVESFRLISVRVSFNNGSLLWIEPGDKGGLNFLGRVFKAIAEFWGRTGDEKPPSSEAKWWHELQQKEHPVRSAVHLYDPIP